MRPLWAVAVAALCLFLLIQCQQNLHLISAASDQCGAQGPRSCGQLQHKQ